MSEIIYEEGWREAAPAADAEEKPVDEQEPQKSDEERRDGSKPLLIVIQLALSLILALALFLLKTMDSELYRGFMGFYSEELQKPVISRSVFESVDIGGLFGSDPVTVEATPDEADRR